jgi:hypothetical protein
MKSVGIALFSLLLLLAFPASALEVSQTDWSGGGGVEGPVTDWGTQFDTSTDINFAGSPGDLTLGHSVVENIVDATFTQAVGVWVADIDGDTDLDVVGIGSESNEISWWANDGSGGGWTKTLVSDTFQGGRFVRVADLDGDTDMDIIATGAPPFSGVLAWWSNDDGVGGTWTYHSLGSYSNAWEVNIADVDGDSDPDIICASGATASLAWWANSGDGSSWVKHTVSGTATGGYYGALGVDMDGDSDIDLVGTAWNGGTVVWWENADGVGSTWTEHIVSDAVSNPRAVCAVDLDGDTDLDLVVGAFVGNNISCWVNVDGKGTTWTEGSVADDFNSPQRLVGVDMDGDTDFDILGSSLYDNVIVWWENDGSGGGWSEHPIASEFNMAQDVCAADLDGDSLVDVVGASKTLGRVAWWSFTAYAASGDLASSILDVSADTDWGWILWTADAPVGTEVLLSVRASDDSGSMGSWSSVDWGTDITERYPVMRDYFQYQVGFTTTDQHLSPTFSSVDVCPYFHLVSPTDKSVIDTLSPTLDWDDTVLPDFDTYTLWWGTDPTFGTYTEVAGLTESTYTINLGISDGDVIYWRVKALDSSANEFWAPEQDWSFTVDLGVGVELAYLDVRSEDEGVLVDWSFEGDMPAGVRVLREVAGDITPLHTEALPGSAARFLDRDIEPDVEYRYWLEVVTSDGVTCRFGPSDVVTITEDAPELVLYAAYPNPSREVINFVFSLPEDGRAALSVYDLAGRRVATPLDSELTAGRHETTWNCSSTPSGVYLYRLETTAGSLTQRLVISR